MTLDVDKSAARSLARSADTDEMRRLFTEYTLVTEAGTHACRLRLGGVHGFDGVGGSILLLYTGE